MIMKVITNDARKVSRILYLAYNQNSTVEISFNQMLLHNGTLVLYSRLEKSILHLVKHD